MGLTTVEPQPGIDGLEEYKCMFCGMVKESQPIPASMPAVKNLYGFIKDAPEKKEPLPDKEKDQMAWVSAAKQHRAIAEEIILKELIYV